MGPSEDFALPLLPLSLMTACVVQVVLVAG